MDYHVRSDEEYCGTCHSAILGESQLSGHVRAADAGCTDCNDPHGQNTLFENPDEMCSECHKEDLDAMNEALGDLHLRENITCTGCHTLDVPHTFLYNFRRDDMAGFMAGFDCPSEINAKMALQTESESAARIVLESKMNWPTVHRVSRAKSAMKCADCHEMNEELRADFKSLGYSDDDLQQIAWEDESFPAITQKDLDLLVSRPKAGWSWLLWLLGAAAVFGILEYFVSHSLVKRESKVPEEDENVEDKDK